jgi:hypothetical protein
MGLSCGQIDCRADARESEAQPYGDPPRTTVLAFMVNPLSLRRRQVYIKSLELSTAGLPPFRLTPARGGRDDPDTSTTPGQGAHGEAPTRSLPEPVPRRARRPWSVTSTAPSPTLPANSASTTRPSATQVRQERIDRGEPEGLTTAWREEPTRLGRQVTQLTMERELAKRAMAHSCRRGAVSRSRGPPRLGSLHHFRGGERARPPYARAHPYRERRA